MSDLNSEDNTIAVSGPGTSTNIGAQISLQPPFLWICFKAALAPVLSQLTNLNKNVNSVLLDGHDKPSKVGETASADKPPKSVDMGVDLSALSHDLADTDSEPLNLEPAFNHYESSICKVAEGAKHSYWWCYNHDRRPPIWC